MTHPPLVETHQSGPHTRERIVRASDCPAMAVHGIAHVGVADAAAPYAMVRTDLPGAYFLACFSGEGRILLDGRELVDAHLRDVPQPARPLDRDSVPF